MQVMVERCSGLERLGYIVQLIRSVAGTVHAHLSLAGPMAPEMDFNVEPLHRSSMPKGSGSLAPQIRERMTSTTMQLGYGPGITVERKPRNHGTRVSSATRYARSRASLSRHDIRFLGRAFGC